MFEVKILSYPAKLEERVERVVQKHSGGLLDHDARLALLKQVLAGQPQVIARYVESHCADNVQAEIALLGATCEVAKAA